MLKNPCVITGGPIGEDFGKSEFEFYSVDTERQQGCISLYLNAPEVPRTFSGGSC